MLYLVTRNHLQSSGEVIIITASLDKAIGVGTKDAARELPGYDLFWKLHDNGIYTLTPFNFKWVVQPIELEVPLDIVLD